MDVHFYEVFQEEEIALQRHVPAHLQCSYTSSTIQESGSSEPPAPIISIRTQSIIPATWIGKVRAVLSRSTGFDHLELFRHNHPEAAGKIAFGYLEEYSTRAVAEHAMLFTLALSRKLKQQMIQFPSFSRDGITGHEISLKNLLVVGVGRIGSDIVRIGTGFGMTVRGVDIVMNKDWVSYVEPAIGFGWADVVVCAMNLTTKNKEYFKKETFGKFKPGAIFINIARGELAPVMDVEWALDQGILSGVGLDVFDHEAEVSSSMRAMQESKYRKAVENLLDRPNVLLTPHNAFNTYEAVERKSKFSAQQIIHFIEHGSFIWKV